MRQTLPSFTTDDDVEWSEAETAAALGQSLPTLRRHRLLGLGPPSITRGRFRFIARVR
jgi:hypothetical protein